MPISLWKDHRKEIEGSCDLAALKEKYVADGARAAQSLMNDSDALAAWLSGPFDMSRVSPASDLHVAVLIRSGKTSFYHHKLPHFSEAGRRLETVFLPLEYLQSVIENGFSDWTDVFELHKLSEVEILFEKNGVLTEICRRLPEVRPRQLFIGRQIELLRREIDLMKRFLSECGHAEAVLSARRVFVSSLRLLLVTNGTLSSKLSHLYPELKGLLTKPGCAAGQAGQILETGASGQNDSTVLRRDNANSQPTPIASQTPRSDRQPRLAGVSRQAPNAGYPRSWVQSFELVQTVKGLSEKDASELLEGASNLVKLIFDRQSTCNVAPD